MLWRKKHGLKAFFIASLWPLPVVSVVLTLALAAVTWRVDGAVRWELLGFSPEGATAMLAGTVGVMTTFLAFVFTILLVAVQFASNHLSPRVLRTALRDRTTKVALATFVSTFAFALTTMSRVHSEFVPQLALVMVALMTIASILLQLILLDKTARNLRATSLVARVAKEARVIINSVYARRLTRSEDAGKVDNPRDEEPSLVVRSTAESGILLAIDIKGLVRLAGRTDCEINFLPYVGDFVPIDAPLFHVYGAAELPEASELLAGVAIGAERTMDQDPAFGFRILVDIAAKALSPGVNDPTTAVLAIDQIHLLLQVLGERRLAKRRIGDASGHVRLTFASPSWEDYVSLATSEIRLFANGSLQVYRRLTAMLEHLIRGLPASRAAALQEELELLHRATERDFADIEDRQRANVDDLQGLGSARRASKEPRPASIERNPVDGPRTIV
jgi:uncharacterized membrane protein